MCAEIVWSLGPWWVGGSGLGDIICFLCGVMIRGTISLHATIMDTERASLKTSPMTRGTSAARPLSGSEPSSPLIAFSRARRYSSPPHWQACHLPAQRARRLGQQLLFGLRMGDRCYNDLYMQIVGAVCRDSHSPLFITSSCW